MDKEAIKQALLARAQRGGSPMSGGGASPMSGQPRVMPMQAPMGGSGSPTPNAVPNQSTTPPDAPRVNIGSRQPAAAGGSGQAAGMARVGQVAQGPNFDDETKKVAKVLVTKLIGYL